MVSSYQGHMEQPTRDEAPRVEQFMSRSFVKLSPGDDIYNAMKTILKAQVSGAVVLDREDKLLGFVSEKDLLRLAVHNTYDTLPAGGPVANYMSTDMVTLSPRQGISDAAEIFLANPYRKIPVVDHGKVIGVVRRRDILRVIEDFYQRRMSFMRAT